MSPLLDKPTAQKDQALIHTWESGHTPSHPSTLSARPHPLQREPGADKTLGQGGGGQGTGDAGEGAQGAGQGCADSWSCQSENREPHPQPWGVPGYGWQ